MTNQQISEHFAAGFNAGREPNVTSIEAISNYLNTFHQKKEPLL